MSLGSIIRDKREELGLTLDEVSRRIGYSKPYLSTIETGRVRNPPADDLLVKLEELLKFETGLLVHIAHMEKLPADVRQAFENSQAENEQWRALIRHVINEGGDIRQAVNIDQFRQVLDRVDAEEQPATEPTHLAGKLVPVINNVSAGYPMDYDDKGYPPGGADDYVRCPDLHDPNAFAVRVVGDSMEPKYTEGNIVVFSPSREVRNGDDCFVRMTNPHETTFKRVFFEPNGQIRLQPRNHQYPPMFLPPDKINGLWRAVIRYDWI
ncbi:MAG: helix-turn-helix domain-containing protein [Sedimentisphaerales bacterium]|nr:helix-turn-helix domain-containing protein [Sedimentisphaerales bacterium]